MIETLSAALVISIVVSLAKPFIERALPPMNPLHDGTIRLLAVLVGVAGSIVRQVTTGVALTGPMVWSTAQTGLVAGVAAIASYHLVTSDYFTQPPASGRSGGP